MAWISVADAWADEVGKWRHAEETFDMLQFGLRLGRDPRLMITTTPRPLPLLKKLNAALAAIKADGTYQKISDKWFPQ